MTLQQLYYIITISESGSINRAAEKLYVSQPSLTLCVTLGWASPSLGLLVPSVLWGLRVKAL